MNNSAILRRLATAGMIIAIVSGTFSMYLLFTSPVSNPTWLIASLAAYALGWWLNRRANAIDKSALDKYKLDKFALDKTAIDTSAAPGGDPR